MYIVLFDNTDRWNSFRRPHRGPRYWTTYIIRVSSIPWIYITTISTFTANGKKIPLWSCRFCDLLTSLNISHKTSELTSNIDFKYKYFHFKAQTADADGKSFTFAVRRVKRHAHCRIMSTINFKEIGAIHSTYLHTDVLSPNLGSTSA